MPIDPTVKPTSLEDLGLDDAFREKAWERAKELIRERGEDPDALLAQAAKNLTAWQEFKKNDPDGYAKAVAEGIREWAEYEIRGVREGWLPL